MAHRDAEGGGRQPPHLFLEGGDLASTGAAMLADPVDSGRPRQFAGPGAEIMVGRSGTELVGHTGDTYGYLTFAFAVPDYDVTMVGHVSANRKEVFVALLQSTTLAVREACNTQ